MKILGVHFAPLRTPFHRRLQTLAALGWITLLLTGAPLAWIFFLWSVCFSPLLRIPLLVYGLWMYFDQGAIVSGARRSRWVRNWQWWKKFQQYFPVKLVKTYDLSADRSYLFATFPHGILSVGSFCAFSTDSCQFEKVFPGLTPITVTLKMHFVTPFIRELGLAFGSIPADESVMLKKLSEKGNALCLVVGGAEEAFHSTPGEYNILLERRKGFIRVALRSGASLVPTVLFNEPEVFDQIHAKPGTFLRWTQDSYKKLTGIAPVYLKGRGVFQYTYGLLPFRAPVTVVAGKPINIPKTDNPTKQQIDELHAEFTKQLVELFNAEKHKYVQNSPQLTFVPNSKQM